MNNFKIIAIKIILLFSLSIFPTFADESCVPESNEGPCPDTCNPMCCNYDPDAPCDIPLNTNDHYLIYIGFVFIGFVVLKCKKNITFMSNK